MTEILLFTNFREQLGQDAITWSETPISVRGLKDGLREQYKLTNLEDVMIAINEEYAQENTMVEDGDTVALIQPVSGG